MSVEVKFLVDTEEEKLKIEAEAKSLGLTASGFLRLLVKNWEAGGSINLSKKRGNSGDDPQKE